MFEFNNGNEKKYKQKQKNINMDGTTLPVRKFKLSSMARHPLICMVAKRASGKSWVVRSIMRHHKDIPVGMVIAPTDKFSVFYGHFFPGLYIHYEYDGDFMQQVLRRQQEIMRKRNTKALEKKKVDPRAIIVMDDCLADKNKWATDKFIKEIFLNGRHFRITFILTSQFAVGLSPDQRTNIDYIFLLRQDQTTELKKYHQHYAGMFDNFETFKKVFTDLTTDYTCMVIVNRNPGPDLLDKIFWYKADSTKIKKMGSKQFRKFNRDNYNVNWLDGTERINTKDILGIKNKNKIVIKKET